MMTLYRQHVLKDGPGAELVQIGGIQPAAPAKSRKKSAASASERAGAPPPLHQDRPRPGVKRGRGSNTDYFFFFFVAVFFLATDGAAGACAVSRPASEAPSGDPSPLQASQPGPAL